MTTGYSSTTATYPTGRPMWSTTTSGQTVAIRMVRSKWVNAQKYKYNLNEPLEYEYAQSTTEPKKLTQFIQCMACGAKFEDTPGRKKHIAFVAEIRKIRTAADLVKAYGKVGIEDLFMPVPYSLSEVCGNCYDRAKLSKDTLRCIPVKHNKKAFDNQCRKYGVLTYEQALEKKRKEDELFASVLTRYDDPVNRTVTYSSSSGKSVTWSAEGFYAMTRTDAGVMELENKIMELVSEKDMNRLDQMIRYGQLEAHLVQDRTNNSSKGNA